MASGVKTRSGARIVQLSRAASCRSLMWRGSAGLEAAVTMARSATLRGVAHAPSGRNAPGGIRPGCHIGVVQGVELRPQHVALEAHGIDGRRLLPPASWRGA